MSQKKTNFSDDEFEDALSDTSPRKEKSTSAETAVEDLIYDLKLPDDETDEEAALAAAEGEEATTATPQMIDDDDGDEEAQREHEKTMSEEELLRNKEEADKMKLQGNELFKDDAAERAVEVYTAALKICPTTYTKERAILFGNRAAAKIKLEARKSAIDDCTKAIALWPDYLRAILRRAKLYELDDKLDEALEDYKRVYELDPGQREAREAMVRLPPIVSERNERLKEEMMGKLKDLGNMFLKPFGLSTANFQMQQDPGTGSYSINFNQGQNQ